MNALPAITPEQAADGWDYAPEVIDDNMPYGQSTGHGTGVACLLGATSDKMGVAPQTNLYLMKLVNFYTRQRDDMTEKALGLIPISLWIDVLTRILDAWQPADEGGEGIDPHRSVINLSTGKLTEPDLK